MNHTVRTPRQRDAEMIRCQLLHLEWDMNVRHDGGNVWNLGVDRHDITAEVEKAARDPADAHIFTRFAVTPLALLVKVTGRENDRTVFGHQRKSDSEVLQIHVDRVTDLDEYIAPRCERRRGVSTRVEHPDRAHRKLTRARRVRVVPQHFTRLTIAARAVARDDVIG